MAFANRRVQGHSPPPGGFAVAGSAVDGRLIPEHYAGSLIQCRVSPAAHAVAEFWSRARGRTPRREVRQGVSATHNLACVWQENDTEAGQPWAGRVQRHRRIRALNSSRVVECAVGTLPERLAVGSDLTYSPRPRQPQCAPQWPGLMGFAPCPARNGWDN